MDFLPVLLAYIAAAVTIAATLHARTLVDRAMSWSKRYTGLLSRISQLEQGLENLIGQHRRLSGKFYQMQDRVSERDTEPEPSHEYDAVQVVTCENFLAAQIEGPMSKAARCDCAYCNWQRAERARTRATLLPKTAAAQGETARKNSRGE